MKEVNRLLNFIVFCDGMSLNKANILELDYDLNF